MTYISQQDPDIQQAIRVVKSTYGDDVSVISKAKNLSKFGRTENADANVETTVAEFQGSVVNETYVSTNIIDSISSSDSGDTESVTIEGHTISAGQLTFVVQSVTLTGQTEATLSTPLCRATRAYNNTSTGTELVGNIYIYDNTGVTLTAGVPDIEAATKLLISAGEQQSYKAATAISNTDYYFITSLHGSILRNNAGAADIWIEIRDVENDNVFRPITARVAVKSDGGTSTQVDFNPYLIVPKNHDMKILCKSTVANAVIEAGVEGYLAAVV